MGAYSADSGLETAVPLYRIPYNSSYPIDSTGYNCTVRKKEGMMVLRSGALVASIKLVVASTV